MYLKQFGKKISASNWENENLQFYSKEDIYRINLWHTRKYMMIARKISENLI